MASQSETPSPSETLTRFYALDCVRASAMLLGVFYHSIQSNMFTDTGLTSSFLSAFVVMELLHCFRMPLFFMISGFFCAMMFDKYGLAKYLAKRWWRILTPMLIAIFVFGTLHTIVKPPAPMDMGPLLDLWDQHGPYAPKQPLPPELVPFDEDQDGNLSKLEWKTVFADRRKKQSDAVPDTTPPTSISNPPPFEMPGNPDEGIDISELLPRVGPMARTMFGANARYFTLGHLWFLWYLLVFATIGPLFSQTGGWLFLRRWAGFTDHLGQRLLQLGLIPLCLGLLAMPALMQTRGLFGWSLGMAEGIFVTFPDVLFQFQWDMPFYFLYFMTGWWLFRYRRSLSCVVRFWVLWLVVGGICFLGSLAFSGIYSRQPDHPLFSTLRIVGYAVSSIATACLAWGFLGGFQRFLDRPNVLVRYLANTAFWIYLVHQELLPPTIRLLASMEMGFWPLVVVSSAISTGLSLILYELFIRHTPLVHLFGVVSPKQS